MLIAVFLLCLAMVGMVGCGAVGAPLPPLLDIPQAATGLTAVQSGERILISWPVPTLTTEGESVRPQKLGPTQLYRAVLAGLHKEVSQQEFQSAAAEVAKVEPGKLEFADRVDPAWYGHTVVYGLLMTNHRGESAGFSNLAAVAVLETPPAPVIRVNVTETAMVVLWNARGGAAYRVYRDGQPLGAVTGGEFQDQAFEFDREYRYMVRGLAQSGEFSAESVDSNTVIITPLDTFAPKPPQGLRAVAVEGAVDLSWSPSSEADLAGYNVCRGGVKLNQELLVSPTYRDSSPGTSPRYTVKAVDRRGNESGPSEEAVP